MFDYERNRAVKESWIKVNVTDIKKEPGLRVLGMVHGRKAWPLGVNLDPSMLDRKRMVALGKVSEKSKNPQVSDNLLM